VLAGKVIYSKILQTNNYFFVIYKNYDATNILRIDFNDGKARTILTLQQYLIELKIPQSYDI